MIRRQFPELYYFAPSIIVGKEGQYYYAMKYRDKYPFIKSSDASEVIQSVIDHVSVNNGMVFLRSGVYEITKQINIPACKISIVGESAYGTELKAVSSLNSIFKIDPDAVWVRFAHLLMRSRSGTSPEASILIDASRTESSPRLLFFEDVILRYAGSRIVDLTNNEEAYFLKCWIGVPDETADYGIYVEDINGNLNIERCVIEAKTSPIFFRRTLVEARPSALFIDKTVIGGPDVSTNKGITLEGSVCLIGRVWTEKVQAVGITGQEDSGTGYRPDLILVGGRMNNPITGQFRTVYIRGLINFTEGAYHSYMFNIDASIEVDIEVFRTGIRDVSISAPRVRVRDQLGYIINNVQSSGVAVFSGDGSTTTFRIEHGLAKAPSKYVVSPLTPDAHADKTISADDTYIIITFDTAPPSGTDNLKFGWWAEV